MPGVEEGSGCVWIALVGEEEERRRRGASLDLSITSSFIVIDWNRLRASEGLGEDGDWSRMAAILQSCWKIQLFSTRHGHGVHTGPASEDEQEDRTAHKGILSLCVCVCLLCEMVGGALSVHHSHAQTLPPISPNQFEDQIHHHSSGLVYITTVHLRTSCLQDLVLSVKASVCIRQVCESGLERDLSWTRVFWKIYSGPETSRRFI